MLPLDLKTGGCDLLSGSVLNLSPSVAGGSYAAARMTADPKSPTDLSYDKLGVTADRKHHPHD